MVTKASVMTHGFHSLRLDLGEQGKFMALLDVLLDAEYVSDSLD